MATPDILQPGRKSWHARMRELMPFRVREILLVSSSYDAFILEEDGPLGERLFTRYSEMNLSWSPRITHVSNGLKAMELLDRRWFDLVIAMPRLEDTNVSTLARMVKRQEPDLPVVVLSFSEAELHNYPGGIDDTVIDRCFLWTGDTRILITINKLIEDRKNISHDTQLVGVPAIIVVEDSVRHYSMFLTELYGELMLQAQSLVAEGVNNLHKLLRMRTRPKVVHARSYEEAIEHFEALSEHVFALITDMRFPRNGVKDTEAGLRLVESVRETRPDLPILIQSAEHEAADLARSSGVRWVNKGSSDLLRQLRDFVSESMGFGDFFFRMPDRTIVGQARDMHQMGKVLRTVPAESVEYHANNNHFSVWFKARGMFGIAEKTMPAKISDFAGIEGLRQFLIKLVRQARVQEQEGMITDFTSWQASPESVFLRLGQGSIGGKARGIAFANSVLVGEDLLDRFPGLQIRIPKTVVIATEEFDKFVDNNGISELLPSLTDDRVALQRFLDGQLPDELKRDLKLLWQDLHGPLAVRSSGLLEDLQFQPFSGVYSTYMLPNNHPDLERRFDELCRAITAVYASTFSENARTYVASTPFRPEEEKMAITIQQMVGQEHHGRFYPHFSGVALSYNYYPVAGQRAEDGTVLLALGLGQLIVAGGAVLRFCPTSPQVLPQFQNANDIARLTQKQFYALDMTRPLFDFQAGSISSLELFDLAAAEDDGTLALAGSVYSQAEDAIRDNLKLAGPRAVTFNNVLKWNAIPLAEALVEVLRVLRQGMGCALEIEFAVDMGDWAEPATEGREPILYILQIRPLATQFTQQHIDTRDFSAEHLLCHTNRSLGHGIITDISDIVYVKRNALDHHATTEVAKQVGAINTELHDKRRLFMLIGPGRWGSSDPRLGIPVEWKQISGARIIAETKLEDREVEPSQGTHFFQNITSLGIGYLTLTRIDRRGDPNQSFVDFDWLDSQPAANETPAVRHVHLDSPILTYLDGRQGAATILKPGHGDEDPLATPDYRSDEPLKSPY
ncbi:PEP/pyruvate-binding domain-containing protein [Myxococcota bacterium]